MDSLQAYLEAGSDRRPQMLRAYFEACQTNGEVKVQYVRKYGWPGRCYAKSPALQMLTREARRAAFSSEGLQNRMSVEIDIENCWVTLICNLLLDESGRDLTSSRGIFNDEVF